MAERDSILNKNTDAAAAAKPPEKVDFSTIFAAPDLKPKPAGDTSGTAPKVTTGDSTGSAKPPVEAPVVPAKVEPVPAAKDTPAKVEPAPAGKDTPARVEPAPAGKDTPAKVEPAPAGKDTPTATADKPAAPFDLTKPLSPELARGLTLSKEVARILDNDVPQANRAQKLTDAEAAYNKAIEIAKQVTPEQIAAAKADYEAVLKAKATEKDPERLRALAERQAASYTLMRVNDCAQGNKALWLYRQGRIEEGNTQFLQAAGLSPEDAKNFSKLTPEQTEALGKKLDANAAILTDENFMRQYSRIKESGQKLPEAFVEIHKFLRERQEQLAAAAKPTDTRTGVSLEASAPAGADTQAARIAVIKQMLPNEAANIAAINEGFKLSSKLAKEGAKALTPEQQKTMEASVKAADDNLPLAKAKYEFTAEELSRRVPAEKAAAFSAAMTKVESELTNIVAKGPKDGAGNPAIAPADAALLQTFTNVDLSTADRAAAVAKLGQTHPEFAKAVGEASAIVGTPEKGFDAIGLKLDLNQLENTYLLVKPQVHINYAALLQSVGGKAADGSDNKTTARAVLESSFTGLPDEITRALVADPVVAKLATDLNAKLPVVAASADTVNSGRVPDSTPLPGQTTDAAVNPAAANPAAPGDMAAQLAAASPEQLIDAAQKMAKEGPDYIPQTKALFEEYLKRVEDPARLNDLKKKLEDKVVALEKGQTIDGKPLDAATRLKYHEDNAISMSEMQAGINARRVYAAYLGGKDALAVNASSPEKLQPVLGIGPNQMDLNKSMDDQLKLIYAAADKMPVDLMKREKANLEKSMATIGSSDKQKIIPQALDLLQGTKERPGVLDIAVTVRSASAMMYISQGAQFNETTKKYEHRSDPKVDMLYQPTKAVELLKEADAKYKEIHGANATDPSLEQLKNFGAQLAPAEFAKITTAANHKMFNYGSDILNTGLSYATQLGVAAIASKYKMGFAAKHAIADVTTFGVNYGSRSLVMRLGTGEWEAPAETAVHAAGVTALVSGMKYTGMGVTKYLNRNLDQSVANAAKSAENALGEKVTLGAFGEGLANKGLRKEALMVENSGLGAKALSELSESQLRMIFPAKHADTMAGQARTWQKLNPEGTLQQYTDDLAKQGFKVPDLATNPNAASKVADLADDQLRTALPQTLTTRGSEAKALIEGSMTKELQAINELRKHGINTFGDLRGAVAKDLDASREFVEAAKALPGYEKMTPRQAMEALGDQGNTRFNTAGKIREELAALDNGMRVSRLGKIEAVPILPKIGPISGKSVAMPTRKIETMGDLQGYVAKATPASEFNRLFPSLSRQSADAHLVNTALVDGGEKMFGSISRSGTGGQGWRALDRMAPEVSDITKRTWGQWGKETLITNRFWSGLSLPKGSNPVLSDATLLKTVMNRRDEAALIGGYVVGIHAYGTSVGLYDRLAKGVDENGQPKKYTFNEALMESNFGSTNPTGWDFLGTGVRDVSQGLLAGGAFGGFSRMGLAKSADLGVWPVLRQNFGGLATPGILASSPLIDKIYEPADASFKLRTLVNDADKPLSDYDYGFGNAIQPDTSTQPTGNTGKPLEQKAETQPVVPAVEDPAAKARRETQPMTNADTVSSPDSSP